MIRRRLLIVVGTLFLLTAACGVNSVTKAQIEAVKVGDVLVYRYQEGGKSWFYADKVTRIEGDKVFFNPSDKKGTAGNDERLKKFDTNREVSTTKAELVKYETEQGEDRKVIIWINP